MSDRHLSVRRSDSGRRFHQVKHYPYQAWIRCGVFASTRITAGEAFDAGLKPCAKCFSVDEVWDLGFTEDE